MNRSAEQPSRTIVVGDINYPSGGAPSNRVHLYCKALKEGGAYPFVINVSSMHKTKQPFGYLGRVEGIPFYYCQKNPVYESNILKRNLRKASGVINSFRVIKRLKKKESVSVLFFGLNLTYEFIYSIFLRLLKIPIVKEINEAPSFVRNNKKNLKTYEWFHSHFQLKMYDRIIVISSYLRNFYSGYFHHGNIFQIPILVDMERFKVLEDGHARTSKVITYVGFMGGNKDGLDNLIEALAKVKEKETLFKAQLVGYGPKKDMEGLKKKVAKLGLEDHVSFLGSKTPGEIPEILKNSDFLILARPDTNQAKAGFPTKLGEYLASSKPVVITRTGEISNYLEDGRSAYVVAPDDNELLAKKIVFALRDPNASSVGFKGYEVARNNFDYKLYKEELMKIFTDFSAKNNTIPSPADMPVPTTRMS